MIIYLSLLVCIVGAFLYKASDVKPDNKQLGYAAFWVGLFVFLFKWSGVPLEVIGK